MSQAKVELLVDSSQVKSATNDLKNLAAQGAVVESSTNKATDKLGKFGRTAGQTGIQMSQLVGQIQGGTSAFTALSQQAADIGFVMGAPLLGAIVSISAAFGGMIASLYDTEDAADKANDSLKRLKDTQEEFKPTVTISIISELNSKFDESQQVTSKLTKQQEFLRKAINESSGDMRKGYIDALARVEYQLETQREIQVDLAKKIEETTAASLESAATDGDVTIAAERAAETKKRLTEQLTVQKIALEQGEVAAQLYSAALILGVESVDKLDPKIRSLIVSVNTLKDAQKSAADELRASSDEDLAALADEFEQKKKLSKETADALKQDSDDYLAQLETEYQARQAFMQLQGEFDPVEAEAQRYAKQLEVIRTYRAQEGADQAAADQAAEDAERAHQDNLLAIKKQGAQASMAIATGNLQAAGELLGTLSQLAYQGGEKSFTLYKRLAQGQAIVAGSLAIIRALAEGGPFLGPALAAATGALVGAQVAIIEKQQYQPRALGGQVSSSGSYLVGERGPELFTPSSSGMGRITPFNQLMNAANDSGSNNAPVINISNYGGQAEVQSVKWSEQDRRWMIDVIAGDVANRGKIHSAITRSTTAGNRSV